MTPLRALCTLPDGPNYQRADFLAGLRAAGVEVVQWLSTPQPGDIVLVWNRGGSRDLEAKRFEAAGGRALVVENGLMGKRWRGEKWFSMAWGHHAGAGTWPAGGPVRWDRWDVHMAPWRASGGETVILAQRGIGEPGVASPPGWAEAVQRDIGGRIRRHPGPDHRGMALVDDLRDASAVVTWHSAAALQALALGVPVFHAFARWIGAGAARPLSDWGSEPRRDDAARLAMFRRAAWAMWTSDEVRSGEAFRRLGCTS